MPKELNQDDFHQTIKSDTPTIVDFWASWCGPCQMMAPIFEKVSADYEGKMLFAKVNTEENQQLAVEHGIRSIPCLVIFKGGEEIGRIVGLRQEADLKAEIDKLL